MKKIIFIFITTVIMLGSCKDFLEEQPVGRLTQYNFYSSAEDAIAGVNAIYSKLWGGYYERDIQLMTDVTCDDVKNGGGMQNAFLQDLEFLRYTPDNKFITSVWAYGYDMANKANVAISNISDEDNLTMDEDLRKRLLGEAKFLRGLDYFNMVRLWGSIPLILKIESMEDMYRAPATEDEIYAQIIEDLSYAADNLPYKYDEKDYGRITKGAAQITLGKVYLTMKRWQDCVDILSKVVNNESTYGYGLMSDYKDNFRIETQHGIENVLGIDYTDPPVGNGNKLMQADAPKYSIIKIRKLPGLKAGWESEIPSIETYNLFNDLDERKTATFRFEFYGPSNHKTYHTDKPMIAKYFEDFESSAKNGDLDFMIIRYSDALLMLAEALNETDKTAQAETYLNRVRERAFNDSDHNYNGLSQSDFRKAVWLERRLEFVHEAQRWFDLKRTNRLVERMKEYGMNEFSLTGEIQKKEISQNVADKFYLFPIPQRELDLNPSLKQNPGY